MNEEEKRAFQMEWVNSHPVMKKDEELHSSLPSQKKPVFKKRERIFNDSPVDMEIDLHGYAVDEAMVEVECLFQALCKSRYKSLRVIHGLAKQGQATIFSQLSQNIRTIWRNKIENSYQEKHNSGATIIILKMSKF